MIFHETCIYFIWTWRRKIFFFSFLFPIFFCNSPSIHETFQLLIYVSAHKYAYKKVKGTVVPLYPSVAPPPRLGEVVFLFFMKKKKQLYVCKYLLGKSFFLKFLINIFNWNIPKILPCLFSLFLSFLIDFSKRFYNFWNRCGILATCKSWLPWHPTRVNLTKFH